LKRFLSELRRRKVVKSLVAYVGISWLILQIVSVLGSIMSMSPLVGPGTFLLLACGLPVVLYWSWHFDFSFGGISRTPSLDEKTNPQLTPLGWLRWTGLMAVVLVSGFLGVHYFDLIKQEQQVKQASLPKVSLADSIAVLPFTDKSPAQNQSYLALGLAEEITSLLGRSDDFKVSASRSSQILAEKGLGPAEIGQRLKVATVLTGSVSAIGERLNVRVELLATDTGQTLWTENFSRELKDVFAIESEIGRAVVNLLQDKYIAAGSFDTLSNTSNTDAYVMFLKGREQYRKQTTESMKEARHLFEQAVALDPEYAKAYVGLADSLIFLSEGETEFGIIKTDIAATLAKQNIDKALARQPEMAEAYAVKGYISFMLNDFDKAITDYDKAIDLNPNFAIAYMWKYLALLSLQRFEESFLALEKSLKLDPLFLTGTYNMGVELTRLGRFDEAEAVFKQLGIDFPDSTFSHQGLADTYYSQGDYVGAIREAQKATRLSPDNQDLVFKILGPLTQLGLVEVIKEQTSDPFYDATILIFEHKYQQLFEKMDFEVAADPDDYWISFEAGWYQAMFGDKQKALILLTEKSDSIDDVDKFFMPYCSPAIEIAWAQRELGNEEQALTLIGQCTNLMKEQLSSSIKYFELHYLKARIYALQGRTDNAILALQTAINNGWREWWTKYDPLLKSLAVEPKFQTLMQFIDDDLARQGIEAAALFTNNR
jgi:TolB-like protein/tetratricopeptide (TPR) repeat protein